MLLLLVKCLARSAFFLRLVKPISHEAAAMDMARTLLQNKFLAALSADVMGRLRASLSIVHLPPGEVLYESGVCTSHVYFPDTAIVSLRNVMENGASTEVSKVGNEGLVGTTWLLGGSDIPVQATVQSAGTAYRLPASKLKEEFNRHGELPALILRYSQSLITQTAQLAACNRHHSVDQQLSRWLLLTLDSLSTNLITITQSLIAEMLGVRRESVTDAAGKLQKLGSIHYARGQITVTDHAVLEAQTCECCAVIRRERNQLLRYYFQRQEQSGRGFEVPPRQRPDQNLWNPARSSGARVALMPC